MKIHKLSSTSKRYDRICKYISDMYENIIITGIEYIENDDLEIKNENLKIVKAFYEVTNYDKVYDIASEGFKDENKVNSICGIGVPFTSDLNLETIKIIGQYLYCELGVDGYDYNIYGEKYNTYVDDKENPSIFLVKDVKNVCPKYIISYHVL